MNTETATDYRRFKNMDPAHVWETFERDTIQNAFVEWAREDEESAYYLTEFIDYHVSAWAGVVAETTMDYCAAVAFLTDSLRCYCRELGDAYDRVKLIRDAINAEHTR